MTIRTSDPAASSIHCDVLAANGTLIVEGVTVGVAEMYANDYLVRTGLTALIVPTSLTAVQIAAGYADMTIAERVIWRETGQEPWNDDEGDRLPSDAELDALIAAATISYDPQAIDALLDARQSARIMEPTWADLERRWANEPFDDLTEDEQDGEWVEAASDRPAAGDCQRCGLAREDERIGMCDHCWLLADIETEAGDYIG